MLTISGPAQFLPVLQAGIDAKKADRQRQREAAAVEDVPDLTGEEAAPEDARPLLVHASPEASRGASAEACVAQPDDADLDEQAPGWPTGTTLRAVQQAVAASCLSQDLGDDPADPPPVAAEAPSPASTAGASAEASEPQAVTDAEALLARAQDALAAEQTHHPATARRRRPQLTPQIDPLSGWGRQVDGELLPPCCLRTVLASLPGRGGVLRLRPVTAADLRRHDLGRGQRLPSAALRELLGALDGERCRFPGCTRRNKLHAHHVSYWSAGGRTDLDNLVNRECDPAQDASRHRPTPGVDTTRAQRDS